MGVNLSTVNLDGIDPNVAFDAMPAGWYNVQIVGSEMKPTKDNLGQYMELTMQVLDGEHAGRKLFDRLNVVNNNPTAVEIAYKTLKSIYNAIGVARVNDSAELHGRPLKVKVKLRAKTAEYDATNEVQGYDSINSNHQPAGVTAGGVAGAPQGSPPWAANSAAPAAQQAPASGAPPWSNSQPQPAAQPQGNAWQPPAAQQPWAQPGAAGGTGGPPPFTPPGQQAPAQQVDRMANARADGWQAHPQYPGYSWRGSDTVSDDELAAHYPVQQAAQAGPPPFTPPNATPAAGPSQTPPWQAAMPNQQQNGPSGQPTPATGAAGPTPPWAR